MSGYSDQQDVAMSDNDFRRFSALIYEQSGINLSSTKKLMLSMRLRKRLHALNMAGFRQYYDFVSSMGGSSDEMVQMLNVVATNKPALIRYRHRIGYDRDTDSDPRQQHHTRHAIAP